MFSEPERSFGCYFPLQTSKRRNYCGKLVFSAFACSISQSLLGFINYCYDRWTLILLILYCNETFHGYQFRWIHSNLQFLDEINEDSPMSWHVMYNLTILRVMSFCFDWSWAAKKTPILRKEVKNFCFPLEIYFFLFFIFFLGTFKTLSNL
jgi:hypothetical protein